MDIDYQDFVRTLKKPGSAILEDLSPASADALHMAIGVSGEAGELLDAIKRYAIYNKPVDIDNVIEELGDLEFFMEGIRQALNIDRATTVQRNIEKLQKRYSEKKFTNQAAQDRADKV
jgi:NTP pyrophosphatase (non-canonical NTP hydrolase)